MPYAILVVDDDPSLLASLAAVLERGGHAVTRAGDFEQARDLLATMEYDAVIADFDLGGPTGLDLFRTPGGRRHHGRLILATGGPAVPAAATSGLGLAAIMSKPMSRNILLGVVAEVVQDGHGPPGDLANRNKDATSWP